MRWLRPSRTITPSELDQLEHAMRRFYSNPPPQYHDEADLGYTDWEKPDWILHRRIVSLVPASSSVLDIACGPASLCHFFSQRNVSYMGVDLACKQLAKNQARFPNARFLCMHWRDLPQLKRRFDVVTSFFALEHMVYPREFLTACVKMIRPGGLLMILCPNFLTQGHLPSQCRFGDLPGSLMSKLRAHLWYQAILHARERFVQFPLFIHHARRRASQGGAWVINLRPACLETNTWRRDWDAVYMVSEDEVSNYLTQQLGLTLIERGAALRAGSSREQYPDFCYAVAQKQ